MEASKKKIPRKKSPRHRATTTTTTTSSMSGRRLMREDSSDEFTVKKSAKGNERERPLTKKKRGKASGKPVDFAADLAAARTRWQDREPRSKVPKPLRRTEPVVEDATPMSFIDNPLENPTQEGTQRLVASAKDLMDVKALQELYPDRYGRLTPNQVWVLVAAERKGQAQHDRAMARAAKRLKELNLEHKTKYTAEDLPIILDGIRKRRLATNYFLSSPPGGNRETGATGPTLLEQLMADKEGQFRNVWETGTSQASADFSQRGGVEEKFGYAAALKRTKGKPLNNIGGRFATEADPPLPAKEPIGGAFEELAQRGDDYLRRLREETPNYLRPQEMPKYAAAVGEKQAYGVSGRYGSAVFRWKTDIGWRTTRTPGDSWSNDPLQSAMSFVGADHPESVLAYTDLDIVRLAAAEATDFALDPGYESKVDDDGADLKAYVEAQIHGDLTWDDLDDVVLNYGVFPSKDALLVVTRAQAEAEMATLQAFAEERGYGFTVRLGRERHDG